MAEPDCMDSDRQGPNGESAALPIDGSALDLRRVYHSSSSDSSSKDGVEKCRSFEDSDSEGESASRNGFSKQGSIVEHVRRPSAQSYQAFVEEVEDADFTAGAHPNCWTDSSQEIDPQDKDDVSPIPSERAPREASLEYAHLSPARNKLTPLSTSSDSEASNDRSMRISSYERRKPIKIKHFNPVEGKLNSVSQKTHPHSFETGNMSTRALRTTKQNHRGSISEKVKLKRKSKMKKKIQPREDQARIGIAPAPPEPIYRAFAIHPSVLSGSSETAWSIPIVKELTFPQSSLIAEMSLLREKDWSCIADKIAILSGEQRMAVYNILVDLIQEERGREREDNLEWSVCEVFRFWNRKRRGPITSIKAFFVWGQKNEMDIKLREELRGQPPRIWTNQHPFAAKPIYRPPSPADCGSASEREEQQRKNKMKKIQLRERARRMNEVDEYLAMHERRTQPAEPLIWTNRHPFVRPLIPRPPSPADWGSASEREEQERRSRIEKNQVREEGRLMNQMEEGIALHDSRAPATRTRRSLAVLRKHTSKPVYSTTSQRNKNGTAGVRLPSDLQFSLNRSSWKPLVKA